MRASRRYFMPEPFGSISVGHVCPLRQLLGEPDDQVSARDEADCSMLLNAKKNAACAIIRLVRTFGRAFLRACLLALALAVLAFVFLTWQVDALGREDQARPSDTIVVLGARVNADGSPGSDLTSRTYHAVDLWAADIAPHIICTGGFRDEPLSAASVCKRFAVSLGVPTERVFLADGSSNTVEDAEATRQVMAREGWQSAVLVSHPLHLYRARWLFRRAGIDAVTSPTSTDTHRIFPPLRIWYDMREAGGVVLTVLEGWSIIPDQWVAKLQTWAYRLP